MQRRPDAADGRIRWLLLDVGGVLEVVDDDTWPARFRSRWARRAGLSESTAAERLTAAELPDIRTGPGQEAYWAAYAAALRLPAPLVEELRADFWDAYCGVADEALLAALRAVRDRVPMAVLSNSADGAREEEERRFGFSALFDPILYSHEIGVAKPDRRAFEAALTAMRAEPREVLFIDDRLENVEAARVLGLRTHLHVGTADTIAAIRIAVDGGPAGRPAGAAAHGRDDQ